MFSPSIFKWLVMSSHLYKWILIALYLRKVLTLDERNPKRAFKRLLFLLLYALALSSKIGGTYVFFYCLLVLES